MSQTPHTRLIALWKQLMELHDFKSAIIHLDPKTRHELIMISAFVSADAPIGPTDIIHDPVCMYIEGIKENGRRVYFDDPETDRQFL
jgi:hypothetical protein